MSIPEDKLAKLRAFGYTEVEARFLYLVAAHSGYFTLRQFLDFAHAKSGKRSARLVEKVFALGHASARRYNRRSLVFQLRSRQIYTAIGKDHLRNRRKHELPHIKTQLLALDFILAHPQEQYFETAGDKRRYSIERFKKQLPLRRNGNKFLTSSSLPSRNTIWRHLRNFSFHVAGRSRRHPGTCKQRGGYWANHGSI